MNRSRLVGLLVFALVAVALVAGALSVLGPDGPREDSGTTAAAPGKPTDPRDVTGCADVLVVGLDGNGERPRDGAANGRTVEAFASAYARSLAPARTVQRLRVRFGTPQISRLAVGQRQRPKNVVKKVRLTALRAWRAPVAAATTSTLDAIAAAAKACPQQQLALVGYAQGAAVGHAVLRTLAAQDRLDAVVGAVLVSDPDRRWGSTHLDGDPAASGSTAGLSTRRLGSSALPRPTSTFAVWNVCSAGDLVCAPGRTSFRKATSVARSYSAGTKAMARARTGLRARTRLWPVPAPAVQVASAPQGEPVQLQLAVDVAAAGRKGVTWSVVSGLPAGVTLSPTGLLSGTPTSSGTWTLVYRVAGGAPVTTAHTGSVVVSAEPEAAGVSAGGQASCQIRTDRTALCWGRNDYGQLGDGSTERRTSPTPVAGTGWTDISTSGSSTCGIRNGALYCWGLNNFGQAGSAKSAPIKRPKRVGTSSAWTDVSASWQHACGIRSDGSLWCWGQNLRGQLGIGRTDRLRATPQRVGTGKSWASVVTGGWRSCAIRNDGSAWCWGDNTLGANGNTDLKVQSSPRRVGSGTTWLSLSTSWGHTCGTTRSGDLLCWGHNSDGQLGNGSLKDTSTPTPVAGDTVWTQVAAGDAATCALDHAGQGWCWGDNRYGQVSATTSLTRATVPTARPVSSRRSSVVTAGWMHFCTAGSGSATTCWGSNEVGQLGTSSPNATTNVNARLAAPAALPTERSVSQQDADARALAALTPAQVVARDLGDRPAVSAAARKASYSFKMMSFNMLGSQHTAPGGDRSDWAPGRIRIEWADTLIRARGASLVGAQEIQPDQLGSFNLATRNRWASYPGTRLGYAGVPQSVLWLKSAWTATSLKTITIPFMRGTRPQPVVRLRNKASGGELYVINVHLSPGKMEADRDKATAIIIRTVKTLAKDGLPILLTGDFNEHEEVFCKITGQTGLHAALGGSTGTTCKPPRGARVDWIFGSRGTFTGLSIDQGAQVRRTTDHAVQTTTFGVR